MVLEYFICTVVFAEIYKYYELTMLNVIIKTAASRGCSLRVVSRLTTSQFSTSVSCQEKIVKFNSSKRIPKIYTKTGDGGNSSLYTGERRHKTDKVFQALGDVDELSCQIGLAREMALMSSIEHPFVEQLVRVQCILQDIGSCVATPPSSARQAHLDNVGISQRHAGELEEWIDEYTTVNIVLFQERLSILRFLIWSI